MMSYLGFLLFDQLFLLFVKSLISGQQWLIQDFPGGGGANSNGGRLCQTIILTIFSRNLHEIKKRLDPLMYSKTSASMFTRSAEASVDRNG